MDVMGGGERQLLSYANHLKQLGIQADLYDMWNTNLRDYDIFHCFSIMPGTTDMCSYAKNHTGLTFLLSPNLWITEATKSNYSFSMIFNSLQLADWVIVNSDAEAKEISSVFDLPMNKFYTIYNGAEIDFLTPGDPKLFKTRYNLNRPYVLNVANIEPRKNQLEFIKALNFKQPEMDFVIVGGVRDSEYAKKCMTEGGSRLKLVGTLPYSSEMMRSAYSGCTFFAMPSLLETPSIAAIEAAVSGARILITKEGSTQEYFKDSVIYVDPFSQASLQNGIMQALEAQADHSTHGLIH